MATIVEGILALLAAWPSVLCVAAFLGVVGYKTFGIAGAVIGAGAGAWLGLIAERRMARGNDERTSRSGWQFVIGSLLVIAAIAIATR